MRTLVVVLGVLALLVPTPVWAHASLVDSSPRQNDTLDQLPAQVRFEFNEEMSPPAYVVVTDPDGTSLTVGDPVVDGPVVTQEIADGPDGAYTMAYRAVSEDGHPITGEITFTVGEAPATEPAPPPATPDDTESDSFLSGHQIAVGGAAGLFLLAALMLLLARRTTP